MNEIKKVAVLGANGTMGSLSGGVFAQTGIKCIFFARSLQKAQKGIENAVKQARSDVLREYIVPKTYDDFEKELPTCDWILEALGEDIELKREYFKKIDRFRKQGSIVSTVSSSLCIEEMAEGMSDDFKAHFLGTHFFNPPAKLFANELIFHPNNSNKLKKYIHEFCEKALRRVNIISYNKPGFAGNRIGFQFLNEAALYAEKYGVAKTDYLLGPYTGRAMPPLATIDLVGLDIYGAIVNYIYEKVDDERHDTYKMPLYTKKMIDQGRLGNKTGGGFYTEDENKQRLCIEPSNLGYIELKKMQIDFVEQAKNYIHDGNYKKAADILKNEQSEEAAIVRHFILGYISYSFFRAGEVNPPETGIDGIDRVMAYGFSWLPPSGWVDLFGGPKETITLTERSDIPVPLGLKSLKEGKYCKIPDITKYLIAL